MNISNRTLLSLFLVAIVLIAIAIALSLGVSPRLTPEMTQLPREIAPLVERSGGQKIQPSGPLRVKVPEGVESVRLECEVYKSEVRPVEGEVWFPSIPLQACAVTLPGTAKAYQPAYPGDVLLCTASDAVTTCSGGIASEKAGTVTISSDLGGTLSIDGVDQGELPVSGIRLLVGERKLLVSLPDGQTLRWTLLVQPSETIRVHFPDPNRSASPVPTDGSGKLAPR